MSANKLDGKALAADIKVELSQRVEKLAVAGARPGLATVLVGDDPASQSYVRMKHRDCEQVGIRSVRVDLPADTTASQLEEAIEGLNENPDVTGYIVQLPLPKGLDQNRFLGLVDPAKDVDGLHPVNLGKLVLNEPAPLPCTPRGIVELLRHNQIVLDGAEVCIVGRGITVGRPLSLLLTLRSENCTVTQCHTGTKELAAHTRQADIIIAAAGKPDTVTADMIKPGAVLVDVGVSRVDGKIRGDLSDDVWEKASWVTPNPGGVGPMTRAMLLRNVVDIAVARSGS